MTGLGENEIRKLMDVLEKFGKIVVLCRDKKSRISVHYPLARSAVAELLKDAGNEVCWMGVRIK